MIDQTNLGTAIQQIRKRRGMSQDELAENVGISKTFVSLIENGHRGVATETLNQIGAALGVPAAFLTLLATKSVRKRSVSKLLKSTQDAILALVEAEEESKRSAV